MILCPLGKVTLNSASQMNHVVICVYPPHSHSVGCGNTPVTMATKLATSLVGTHTVLVC